jgi:hypothetical protein
VRRPRRASALSEAAPGGAAFDTDDVQQARRTARRVRTSYQPVDEFVKEIRDMQDRAKDFLVPYKNMRCKMVSIEHLTDEGVETRYKLMLELIDVPEHGTLEIALYEHVLGQLCGHTSIGDKAGMPVQYLKRLLCDSKDKGLICLAVANVQELLSRRYGEKHTRGKTGEKKAVFIRTFRSDQGLKCRALLSDRYFPIRTLDMVTIALGAVLGKTGDAGIDKTAAKNAWMFDQRISVEEVNVGFVNPRYAFDLRHPSQGIITAERVTMNDGIPTFHYPGGSAYTLGGKWTGKKENQHLVLPAARISNSETGGGSAVIEPLMIEVACINDMTLMKAMKRNHLGGLMESADVYESGERKVSP